MDTEEHKRLYQNSKREKHWRKWGPYLSERQWGTVREDYSRDESTWNYFTFEQSHLRTYRWGEDGIAGISDNHQRICFAFCFWNGQDSILKERLYGFAGNIGNHGEDVKEYYCYLDNIPSHAYMKYLYKYPQERFPYELLQEENRKKGKEDSEYEIYDTKIFDQDRYFDLYIEYAKQDDEDLLIKITSINRGDEKASLHILPTIWFRNTWSWQKEEKKMLLEGKENHILVQYPGLDNYFLYFENPNELLFTENETNMHKLYGKENDSPYVKDAFHECVIQNNKSAVNPAKKGTKAALHHILEIEGKGEKTLFFRLSKQSIEKPFEGFEEIFQKRIQEADQFYHTLTSENISEDLLHIERQAFSSLLWTKQFYHYVVEYWMQGDDEKSPLPQERKKGRNYGWEHVYNNEILSVPDKWEYPWFASWDLAFHTIPLALLDPEYAKRQLTLLTREWYMHPNGQIPAYEWNFSDVNPPVHSWAAWRVYKIEEKRSEFRDRRFLSAIFQKLLLNFTWWVNRKDAEGKNVFQGGFLGLDNISIFNRSEDLPTGGSLTQADATSWMAMYCLNMFSISMELSIEDPSYEDMSSKFFEHFLYIADAINYHKKDVPPLWNEEDGFYYDLLHYPNGDHEPLKVRSMVGLIPLFAIATITEKQIERHQGFKRRFEWFLENKKGLCEEVASMKKRGEKDRHLLAILDKNKLTRILKVMLDENEFLSPYGIRSVSLIHKDHPYVLDMNGSLHRIGYEPAESKSDLYGGNSNWRGPIWFPMNFLIIESLQKFHYYYGDSFKIEFPTGSGNYLTLWDIAGEIAHRLMHIFQIDEKTNKRAVFNGNEILQSNPHFKNNILFYEYFHGDNGSGLGASHQTGWTSIIAKLIVQYGKYVCEME